MLITTNLTSLLNLVAFEETVKKYSVKCNTPMTIRFSEDNKYLVVHHNGFTFYALLSKSIIHQLASRVFSNEITYDKLERLWKQAFDTSKFELEMRIATAIINYQLSILYYTINNNNYVYGFVTDLFRPINQLAFRKTFAEQATKSDLFEDNSKLSVDKYGNLVERFDLKIPGKIKFSYLLHHARNNGYDAISVKWGRLVIVCSNGLTRIESEKIYKLKHINDADIFSFISNSINEGVELHLRDEQKIDFAINRSINTVTFNEFMQRLHLANVSKNRVIDRLKKEVSATGNNEWALSQALTWMGTHAKEIDFRPKELLKEAGSMILDHSLENYLIMAVYSSGFEKAYGPLLPTNFIKR